MPRPPEWPEELFAAVLERKKEGASASAIAKEFGISRSAILGKLNRKIAKDVRGHWPKQKNGRPFSLPRPIEPKPVKVKKVKEPKIVVKKEVRPTIAEKVVMTPKTPLNPEQLRLITDAFKLEANGTFIYNSQLTPTTCRWPYDHEDQTVFCGYTTEPGQVYCKAHKQLAVRPKN